MAIAPGSPVWPRVAEHVDGVHMTASGARAFWYTPRPEDPRRSARPQAFAGMTATGLDSPLDMWEAESTAWFTWHFTSAERLGTVANRPILRRGCQRDPGRQG